MSLKLTSRAPKQPPFGPRDGLTGSVGLGNDPMLALEAGLLIRVWNSSVPVPTVWSKVRTYSGWAWPLGP